MKVIIIITSILAAAFVMGLVLYLIMARLVRWMDEVERDKDLTE